MKKAGIIPRLAVLLNDGVIALRTLAADDVVHHVQEVSSALALLMIVIFSKKAGPKGLPDIDENHSTSVNHKLKCY